MIAGVFRDPVKQSDFDVDLIVRRREAQEANTGLYFFV
jgi:hypothetical protein